jgi:hypothetical protein
LSERVFAFPEAEGGRRHADTSFEGPAKHIWTLEANTFGDALNRRRQTQESTPRLAQAHFFHKGRWGAVKYFSKESPEMTQRYSGAFRQSYYGQIFIEMREDPGG